MTWRFPHPATGVECVATWDGDVLEVEVNGEAAYAPSWDDVFEAGEKALPAEVSEDDIDHTIMQIFNAGLERTCLPTLSAVRRELSLFGCPRSVLDAAP